jgi:hypothetical protein
MHNASPLELRHLGERESEFAIELLGGDAELLG